VAARTHLLRRGCARRTWDPCCVLGIFSNPQPSGGDLSPAWSSTQPAWTLPLTPHWRTSPNFRGDLSSRRVIYLYPDPDSHPRRTNCVLTRRGRTCLAGEHTPKNTRGNTPVLSSLFLFYFLLAFFSTFLSNQELGG